LRGWPRGGLSPLRIRELHRFLRFLAGRGVEVIPVPIPAINGETLVHHAGQWWQLEPWMPGTADFHQRPSDARLIVAMQLLARLHQEAACYQPTARGQEWFAARALAVSPAVRERIDLLDGWTAERIRQAGDALRGDVVERLGELSRDILDHLQRVRRRLRTDLEDMARIRVPLHPCLRDLWHDHVLFLQDHVTGIVDPSAARTENVAADLSRLLGSMLGPSDSRWETALDAYAAVRPLSHNEQALVRVLHESGVLLSGLTWIVRRVKGRIEPEMLPAVTARLERIRDALPV
jgi:Ser/Thr protein kinase RdoA (MazF antagonist)